LGGEGGWNNNAEIMVFPIIMLLPAASTVVAAGLWLDVVVATAV
jgi:hypothetical protein